MNPLKIIEKYYRLDSQAYKILLEHSHAVAQKALVIAKRVPHFNPDLKFIYEAALLHDIGIFLTEAPDLGCFGEKPYICHGYLGQEILSREGLPTHSLVCERHVGAGLSVMDIEEQQLPLPKRDMLPVSIEEQIICFADKFFSKNEKSLSTEKSLSRIRTSLLKFGLDKVEIFNAWLKIFDY